MLEHHLFLSDIRDWFKENFDTSDFQQVSIGKIDNNLEKALCFYDSKRTIPYINRMQLSTYSIKPITVLIRYGKNHDIAEHRIHDLYEFFDNLTTLINGIKVFFKFEIENPIDLGTDDKGYVELSLEIDCFYERSI